MAWKLKLYSKPDCPLCEEAKAAIQEFAKECPVELETVDVSQDPKLWEAYRFEIPVLLIDGQEAARHHIGLKKLRVLYKRWEDGDLPRPHARVFGAN
ncbi:MAG: glutaredoxin family protein [Planctomycetota bacterium]|nr:glutaredoxin family protein [Planctomycetota bacterium]